MPNIEQIPETLYNPNDQYNYLVDNLPLINILSRMELVNDAVDIASDQIRNAIGTSGSLSNRLNASTNADGTLKVDALNAATHDIGSHADGANYIRMQAAERTKLALVADNATSLSLLFGTPTTEVLFNSGVIEVEPSVGIVWDVLNGNKVRANLTFPTSSIHRHYYDQMPQFVGTSADYIHYQVSSSVVSFIAGSLRIIVNGYLLSQDVSIDVPIGVSQIMTPIMFAEIANGGTFILSHAITAADVIRVDFDILLYTGTGDNSTVVTSGAQGPQGLKGDKGPQGAFGGPQGNQGFQGGPGSNGGTAIGQAIGSGVSQSVLYIDPSGNLDQDSTFKFDQTMKKLILASLTASGGLIAPSWVRLATSANASTNFIGVDCSGGPISLSLPAIGTAGLDKGSFIVVKDERGQASINHITVSSVGSNIDGQPTQVISSNYGSLRFYLGGNGWAVW